MSHPASYALRPKIEWRDNRMENNGIHDLIH